MDLISVVIITYKRPLEILAKAVQSVLRQTYTNLELVVVNDAPEACELEKEIANYLSSIGDKRVKYICHNKNSGANYARNTGLANSNGKYIAYLDDDDEWLPNKLEVQHKQFELNSKLGLVYCGFYIRSENGDAPKNTIIPNGDYLKALVEDNFIGSTSFPMLSIDAIKDVGGFDVKQKSCQEYELWLRIAEKYDVLGIEDLLGVYYVSSDSTFKGNYASYIAGDLAIISKHNELFKRYPIEYGNHLNRMFLYLLKEKQYKDAVRYKTKAIKACWYNPNNFSLIYYCKKLCRR